MKKTALYIAFAFLTAACYHGEVNTPGITADGISPKPPSPAYGKLMNEHTAMTYGYSLAKEGQDYYWSYENRKLDFPLVVADEIQDCAKDLELAQCEAIYETAFNHAYMGMYYTAGVCPFGGAPCMGWYGNYHHQAMMFYQKANFMTAYPY